MQLLSKFQAEAQLAPLILWLMQKKHIPSVTSARVKVKPVGPTNVTDAYSSSSAHHHSVVHPKSYSDLAAGATAKYQKASEKSDRPNLVKGFVMPRTLEMELLMFVVNHLRTGNPYRRDRNLIHITLCRILFKIPNHLMPYVHGFNFNSRGRDVKAMGTAPVFRQFGNSGNVVERVTNLIGQLKWGPAAEEALGHLNLSMDAYQANQVLKQIQDHSVAFGLFNWLRRQPGFKHDGHTYTTMVDILGRAKQFCMINRLLDQMILDGCQPNVVTYNYLIHSYGRANFLTDALRVFNRMQEVGCEPDKVTYCTLIDLHAKAGYLDIAMQMYQTMQEIGLIPNTFTYSVIINCLGKAGHLGAAQKLFYEMVDHGCVPNVVMYNIMIALQAKARSYDSALQIYRDMQNAGFDPDKVTYSIVMEVLGHCGHLEEAEAVFCMMKQKNWVPDEPVYGLLVDLWGKAGNVDRAWGWYHAMLDAGLC